MKSVKVDDSCVQDACGEKGIFITRGGRGEVRLLCFNHKVELDASLRKLSEMI